MISKNRTKSQNESQQHHEMVEKLVNVRRTAKVVKGGRRFSFVALVVVGDGNGKIGYGLGKGREVPAAIAKATHEAKKNIVEVKLHNNTLRHEIKGRHGAAKVFMKPASKGTGVIAGGAMRAVFEVVGVHNVLAKCYDSTNPLNVVRATVSGLTSMLSPEIIARRRGVPVSKINAFYDDVSGGDGND
jgi:small subunit ribosomal protein S5